MKSNLLTNKLRFKKTIRLKPLQHSLVLMGLMLLQTSNAMATCTNLKNIKGVCQEDTLKVED